MRRLATGSLSSHVALDERRFPCSQRGALRFALALAMLGCTVTEPPHGRDAALGDTGSTPDGGRAVDANADSPAPLPARYEVQPASLVRTAGLDDIVSQTFEVYYVDESGARTQVPAADLHFTLDDPRMGAVDTAGHFASGPRSAGTAQLTVVVTTHVMNVPIEITRRHTILAGAATAADVARFDTLVVDPTAEAGVVYPLDGVVMPQDVFPPEIQWTRGAPADAYRFRFELPHVSMDVIYREPASARHAWLVDAALFHLLAQADTGQPVSYRADRFEAAAGRAVQGPSRSLRFAPGVLRGTIYFWDASSSSLRRVAHGSGASEAVDTGGRCVGCHSIAPDGRTIAVRYDGGDGVGGIMDVASGVARDATARWYFSSFSPTGDRLIVDTAAMSLELVDVATGDFIASASPMLPRSRAANPTWSPDGTSIAFITNIDVNYRPGFDSFQDGDLAVLPVTGPDTFGVPELIVDASTLASPTLAPYRCINQPTWSPDGSILVFAAGPYSNTSWANALYSVRMDTELPSTPVRLDAAMGGPARVYEDVARSGCAFPPTTPECCHDVYHGAFSADDGVCVMSDTDRDGSPRFSPFYQGGYFWVVFSSRRPYGNELAGSPRAGAVGAGRPQNVSQLWVAAIDPNSTTLDMSFPPYWLPGQEPTVSNIDAQWAPSLCVSTGDACAVDGECCSGVCGAGGVCATPPPDRCHADGETCSAASDCCDGLLCTGRLCSYPLF